MVLELQRCRRAPAPDELRRVWQDRCLDMSYVRDGILQATQTYRRIVQIGFVPHRFRGLLRNVIRVLIPHKPRTILYTLPRAEIWNRFFPLRKGRHGRRCLGITAEGPVDCLEGLEAQRKDTFAYRGRSGAQLTSLFHLQK